MPCDSDCARDNVLLIVTKLNLCNKRRAEHFIDIFGTMMESTTTPKNTQFIPADDDEFDESSMPAFEGASLPASATAPPANAKGKARADTTQTAPPSGVAGSSATPVLSGTIGSKPTGQKPSSRRTVGGVQVETRYDCVYAYGFTLRLTYTVDILELIPSMNQC